MTTMITIRRLMNLVPSSQHVTVKDYITGNKLEDSSAESFVEFIRNDCCVDFDGDYEVYGIQTEGANLVFLVCPQEGNSDRPTDLAMMVADYLTDWSEDEESTATVPESIEAIESYGCSFDEPGDMLVVCAIRHLDCLINPWNKDTMPELLESVGFSAEEIKKYIELWHCM